MKLLSTLAFVHLIFVLVSSCSTPSDEGTEKLETTNINIIPQPVEVQASNDFFELVDGASIYVSGGNLELNKIANYTTGLLMPATGFNISVEEEKGARKSGNIYLSVDAENPKLGDEGYTLRVSDGMVLISANKPAGVFWGVQTLRQLLPAKIEKKSEQEGSWHIGGVDIVDYPRFEYRGSMLDVARHFFGMEDVKQYIDYIAAYKMNTLHLHLSDDQGWRIEIKAWPNLTEYGGSTQVGGGEGGYYTQEQYKELVQYAANRFITIIPEIDTPGHTNAALASYPQLNFEGQAPELYTGIEVGFSTLSTDKDITYEFLDDVFGELAAITPGPYLHIGGDESHATAIEDYIPFVEKAQEIVQKHGKKVLGWDEIANANLLPNTVVQYWAEAENAKMGVEKGAQVLISPAIKSYLDMQYHEDTPLGLHWAAYIEVQDAYDWDPEKMVEGLDPEDILGIEAPLWSETIETMDDIEYLLFPRLPGLAEVGWSLQENRNWEDYKIRMGIHGERLNAAEINYYASPQISWPTVNK